jgi:hypothetical protein
LDHGVIIKLTMRREGFDRESLAWGGHVGGGGGLQGILFIDSIYPSIRFTVPPALALSN